ncbi:TolC family protein [Hymenobacter canadensis]|uniref:TolC family protein n=1 Tax=Hymenobacter canadensis TaxID=2999067 RepID=A0ABY7LUI5_9BACT|nr:TolC family protein [Hymenobacter canadensis]WBA43072.1 TolC family protein [Hymenobacter canadensis]
MRVPVLLLLALLLCGSGARAQPTATPAAAWTTVLFDAPEQVLPVLLAAALRHSPELEAMQTEKAMAQTDLLLARRVLLSGVQLAGGYGYGNVANLTMADPTLPRSYSTTASSRYTTSLNLNLPLDKLVNRRQLVQRQQLQLQQLEHLSRARQTSIRQRVIDQYQEVRLAHKVVTLRQQALLSAQLNYQMGEKQFRSGELALVDMSQLTDRHAAALVDYETADSRLATGLLQLEELIGEKVADLLRQP